MEFIIYNFFFIGLAVALVLTGLCIAQDVFEGNFRR